MTASADIPLIDTPSRFEPVQVTHAGRMILRGVNRLVGASLALAAFGLWLAPGSSLEAGLLLPKLALSLLALGIGIALMQCSARVMQPEVEIDPIRREVRLIRPQRGHAAEVLQRSAFADLSRVEHKGNRFRLFGPDKTLMADVTLNRRAMRTSLIRGLQDAGKLA